MTTEEKRILTIDDTDYETHVPESYRATWASPDEKSLKAFIPGTVMEVMVKKGSRVSPGDVLLVLDAMKMYNEISSTVNGTVAEIAVEPGQRVEKNQLLVRLED